MGVGLLYAAVAAAAAAAGAYVFYGSSESRKKSILHVGLTNYGNTTCYINVVLQCLSTSTNFCTWLNRSQATAYDSVSTSLHKILTALQLRNSTSTDADRLMPAFRSQLAESSKIPLTQQNDSHEFFLALLDRVIEECCKTSQCKGLKELLARGQTPGLLSRRCPYSGLTAVRLNCSACKHRWPVRLESFNSIILPARSADGKSSVVNDLLESFNHEEKLDGCKCDRCGNFGVNKRVSIVRVPDCLCISIQRTQWKNGSLVKSYDRPSFPAKLSMASGAFDLLGGRGPTGRKTPPLVVKASHRLRLTGVVVHMGLNPERGHYIAYRAAEGKWLRVSDLEVRPAHQEEVMSSSASLLFYEKM